MGTKIKMEFTKTLTAKEVAQELRKFANELSKRTNKNVSGMGAIDIGTDENTKSYSVEPIKTEGGGDL
jgi:hypothetical protein